jgi:hypothetical protein
MEDFGILNWRKWSLLRKVQVVAGCLGCFITLVVTMPISSTFTVFPKDSIFSSFFFSAYLVLAIPAVTICEAFGIPQGNIWVWMMGVVANTVLCILVGSVYGWILTLIQRAAKQMRVDR